MQWLRKLLFPLSGLYWSILSARHKLFDWGLIESYEVDVPTVVLGNLSFGGTGKTPHVIALIEAFSQNAKCAIVSLGYGRSITGIQEVKPSYTSYEIGDEVFLIKSTFPEIPVYVGKNRVKTIQRLMKEHPDVELVILDDAFQYRYLRPSYSILLEDYTQPFEKDHLVPVGRLRDVKHRAKAADAIITTKVPEDKVSDFLESEHHFVSSIAYQEPYKLNMPQAKLVRWPRQMLAVSGLANPESFHTYLKRKVRKLECMTLPDHHEFGLKDIQAMAMIGISDVICTEKDAVKLSLFKNELKSNVIRVWVLPMKVQIHNFDSLERQINEKIKDARYED